MLKNGDRDTATLALNTASRNVQPRTLYLVHSRRARRADTGGQRAPHLHSHLFTRLPEVGHARIPYTLRDVPAII
jgi:hypothetical protein